MYEASHPRICRPVRLPESEVEALVDYAIGRLGEQYDLRHVFNLARYLLWPPPVPAHLRRRLLALCSADPTRAICSSLIAAAFNSIHYPVLPEIEVVGTRGRAGAGNAREILHIRDSNLYAPRDFDMSQYFRIVKPTIEHGFNRNTLEWAQEPGEHCDC